MGRRSTKTTKMGKFMNPTDQWRKEQRKKELKKNKKQRNVVREAVLRMKDPLQMLQEIEEIEKVEIESSGTAMPNEKGLVEKKRKLHSSLDRVMKYYQREDPKKASEIKKLVLDSEKKRRETTQLYNSYRAARSQYDISDIPMPDMPSSEGGESYLMPSDIPMPDELGPSSRERPPGPPPGSPPSGPQPPGPPPGPPPVYLDGYEIVEHDVFRGKRSVRFADEGDESSSEDSEGSDSDREETEEGQEEENEESHLVPPGPPPGPPPTASSVQQQAPPLMQAPPPPPTGPPPMFGQQPFPPRMGLPPGPPPGLPPPNRTGLGVAPQPLIPPNPNRPHIQSGAVLSAPPTWNPPSSSGTGGRAVISAQPQLRNIQAEVTKFMPTSLRVRRDQPKINKVKLKAASGSAAGAPQKPAVPSVSKASGGRMQGDAYDTFMKEMEGLL